MQHLMRFITRTFFKGLVVIVPPAAALYVILWLFRDAESLVKGAVIRVIPEQWYLPGLGVILLLGAIFVLGLLMYAWLARKMLDLTDRLLRRIPLFNTIYSPVKDLMDLLGGDMTEQLGQPVLIEIPGTDVKTLGFITRSSVDDLPEPMNREDHVVVYVQWSSQIGGYCFIVPRKAVTTVDMTVQEGMRWALTAGVSGPDGNGRSDATNVRTDDQRGDADEHAPPEADDEPDHEADDRADEKADPEAEHDRRPQSP